MNVCSNKIVNRFDSSVESSLVTVANTFSTSPFVGANCRAAQTSVFQLLCLNSFQPCDDSGSVLLPNRSHCEDIRDNICSSEWNFIQISGQGSLLPDCASLPEDSTQPSCGKREIGERERERERKRERERERERKRERERESTQIIIKICIRCFKTSYLKIIPNYSKQCYLLYTTLW